MTPAAALRIPLQTGPTVAEVVPLWLLEATDRGLTFRITGDRLIVSPCGRLTSSDGDFIRQHRTDLVACLDYIERLP